MPVFHDLPFSLTRIDVVRGLGMSASPKVRPEIDRLIDETLNDKSIISLIRPALAYCVHDVIRIEPENTYLRDGTVFQGTAIPRHFPEAKALIVAVATIGPELENKVTQLFKTGQRVKGLILDAMGTATTENMRFAIRDIIDKEAQSRGYSASSSLSPGGASWPITEQFKIFRLVPAGEIGMKLTGTAMMVPCKSSSMVMALGVNMPTWSATERCDACPNGPTCPYRYRPEHECAGSDAHEANLR